MKIRKSEVYSIRASQRFDHVVAVREGSMRETETRVGL
jgi:hypothetical protein